MASYYVNAVISVNGIARRAGGGDVERTGAVFLAVDAHSTKTTNNSICIVTGNGERLAVGEDEFDVARRIDSFA